MRTDELANQCFGIDFTNAPKGVQPASFDMRTKHAELYGAAGYYLYSKQQELQDIKVFVEHEKAAL